MENPLSNFYATNKVLLASIAIGFFVVSWILLFALSPIIINKLPVDYFTNEKYLKTESMFERGVPLARRFTLLLKNIFAWFLILIAPVLFQSIFAPFFGLLLAEFKAKPKMIRAFASNRFVWRALNAIRRKKGLPPFIGPPVR